MPLGGTLMGHDPLIAVRNLRKVYQSEDLDVRALDGVSLDVRAGEFVAITGPSGCGKSTFLHILGCLLHPTSGQYFLEGREISALSPNELARIRNERIGFIFQGFNLLPKTTAIDNVELPMLYSALGQTDAERHRRALAALEAVGLADRADHWPGQLSGGQQQRVAIARALVDKPAILLADEPTGNLDTRTSLEVIAIFQRLNVEQGLTVLLVTHERDIATYATRVITFRDGRIVHDEPVPAPGDAARDLAALGPEPDDRALGTPAP
jgi:putative ABC transport system ATP-binding protein